MPHRFIYVVDAHFIDKIEEKKSWTQVPVFLMSYFLISMFSEVKWEVVVSFVDIGGIVDYELL